MPDRMSRLGAHSDKEVTYLEAAGDTQCRKYLTAFYRDPLSIEGVVDEERFGQEAPSV